MKWWIAAVSAACVACSAARGQKEAADDKPVEAKKAPRADAVRVEVAVLTPSKSTLELVLPGEIEGNRDALLAASAGGFVERIFVQAGDSVKKGKLLARIDSATHGAHLAQAEAQYNQAQLDLSTAQKLEGTISASEYESTKTKALASEASLRAAQVQAARAVIRAPFSGVAAQVEVEEGEIAAPGSPIVRLAQLDPVKVTLAVSDRDIVNIRTGTSALVSVNARAEVTEGKVVRVAPAADLKTRAFEVEVEVPNKDKKLLPGMIASVRLQQPIAEDVLLIPQSALVTRLDGNGVFIERRGIAYWRDLTLGTVTRDQVIVERGLSAGDRIVVTGHRVLQDGDHVVVNRVGSCCERGEVVFQGRGIAPNESKRSDSESSQKPSSAADKSKPQQHNGSSTTKK